MNERDELQGHAFISYVRENKHKVDQLQQTLEAAGIRTWRDTTGLWPGEDWRAKIRDAITHNALVFIICFSKDSSARMATYQNEELTLAIEEMRRRSPEIPWLIPVRFDDCEIPDRDIGGGRMLSSIHRADLFGPKAKAAAERLVAVVLRILGQDLITPRITEPSDRPIAKRKATDRSAAAKQSPDTIRSPASGVESLRGNPDEDPSTDASPRKKGSPRVSGVSRARGTASDLGRRSLSADELVQQFAALASELRDSLDRVDDDPQLMDRVARQVHRLAERVRSFAKVRFLDPGSPLRGRLPSRIFDAMEQARANENDMYELYDDRLGRYRRDERKDPDLLKQRRAYISALLAFQAQAEAIIRHLN